MTHASTEMRRFNYLISETEAAYHELSLKLGLSDSCMKILYTLHENGNCCMLRDICYLTGISKQTINSAIRKLEQDDILRTENADAKSKRLRLTDKGALYAAQTVAKIIAAENKILSSWEPADVEKYLMLTERFLNELRDETRRLEPSGHTESQ